MLEENIEETSMKQISHSCIDKMELVQIVLSHPVATGVAGTTLYIILLSIYRLWCSPLAKFPGPKLAALTLWYEFYYDTICRGRYTFRIGEMHKQYGLPDL